MEILGIGPTELVFIVVIAIIVLGPKEMQKAGRTVGRWLNQVVNSEGWKTFKDTTQVLRTLPNRLMREANMEMWEAEQDVRRAMDPRPKPPASPRSEDAPGFDEQGNSIEPPSIARSNQASNSASDQPDKND